MHVKSFTVTVKNHKCNTSNNIINPHRWTGTMTTKRNSGKDIRSFAHQVWNEWK